MPIYIYRCEKCGKLFERLMFRNDKPQCQCGSIDVERDYSKQTTIMKGDIEPHYNPSLGSVVNSRRDLRDKLWLTNSRTEDMSPVGGLTIEERAIRDRKPVPDTRGLFEKRKDAFWGAEKETDVYIDE